MCVSVCNVGVGVKGWVDDGEPTMGLVSAGGCSVEELAERPSPRGDRPGGRNGSLNI